jgi:anaerobic selenocysteine-containing dehydrogenase
VRVVEGRAVKIEGNPDHPINGGGIGPKGQAGLQLLYHPDRITGPLRRSGARGSGKWTQISWEDAIGEAAERLRGLRARGAAHAVVVVDGEPRGLVPRLWERFLRAYGSPNHIRHGAKGQALAMASMQGAADLPAYDWRNTEYVLGFGVPLFESWCQTIHMSRATGALRRGTPGRRVKFVQVSPSYSVTAAKADEWIPIEPATEGALALGIAHVLVREGLHDSGFVRDRTFGFDNWRDSNGREHRGFRDLLIAEYPPDKVARVTGVPAGTIERLAREISTHKPAIALADGTASGATNGLGTAMAIHALNALVGSIGRRGGVLVEPSPLASWNAVVPDDTAATGLSRERVDGAGTSACPLGDGSIEAVPDAILGEHPYPVTALILYRSNPVFSKPEGARWIQAINKVPFVISCSPLPDESTLWADLVLPDHTYLERWEIVEPTPSSGRPVVSFRQPVVPPRHNTRATADVVIQLAKAIGRPLADEFPWENSRSAAAELLRGIPTAPAPAAADSHEPAPIAWLRESGAWSGEQAFGEDGSFTTSSGKFEFYSQAIAAKLTAAGITVTDSACLPHWEPARTAGDPREYPFVLAPHRGINYAEGGVRHLPWLRELPAAGLLAWKETIELNPDDASALAVQEGDRVWVESPAGTRRVYVRVLDGTRRGTLGLPLGHGPWPPEAKDAGTAGGHALLVALTDPLAGIPAYYGTRARIRKEDA